MQWCKMRKIFTLKAKSRALKIVKNQVAHFHWLSEQYIASRLQGSNQEVIEEVAACKPETRAYRNLEWKKSGGTLLRPSLPQQCQTPEHFLHNQHGNGLQMLPLCTSSAQTTTEHTHTVQKNANSTNNAGQALDLIVIDKMLCPCWDNSCTQRLWFPLQDPHSLHRKREEFTLQRASLLSGR